MELWVGIRKYSACNIDKVRILIITYLEMNNTVEKKRTKNSRSEGILLGTVVCLRDGPPVGISDGT